MEHIAAILLVVGCSSDLGECREYPAPMTLYETVSECEIDRRVMQAAPRLDVPNLFHTCVEVDPAMLEDDAELVWDIDSGDRLVASVEVPTVIASSSEDDRVNR